MRESPALDIIELLTARRGGVSYTDPVRARAASMAASTSVGAGGKGRPTASTAR